MHQCHSHKIYIIPMELVSAKPCDLHYSHGADPLTSASSPCPCWGSCCPQPGELWGAADKVHRVPQGAGCRCATSTITSSCFIPRWKALEMKMLRSAEWARQEVCPVPVPNSAEHHFTGQMCLLLPNHKLEGKCSPQCLEEWCFPSLRQFVFCVEQSFFKVNVLEKPFKNGSSFINIIMTEHFQLSVNEIWDAGAEISN